MLRLVAVTMLAGLLVGRLAGGRLRNLASLPVRAVPITFVSAGLVVTARFVGDSVASVLQLAAIGAGGLFLAVNAMRVRGAMRAAFAVLAIGWMLNATVITANDGMPLSLSAYAASGQTVVPTPGEGGFFAIDVADESTILRPLGDVIPISPLRTVVSIGDLVLALGVVGLMVVGMRGGAHAPSRESISRRAAPELASRLES